MKAATHRGNCQVCGHQQHIVEGGLAKHGYTVDFGYFQGTCRGSGKRPVQIERFLTDATIEALNDHALRCELQAKRMEVEPINYHPSLIKTGEKLEGHKFVPVYIDWSEGTIAQQARTVELAIANALSDARGARRHAKMLKEMADRLHGTSLVAISELVKATPAPKPSVDVKNAKVTGSFGSKAARKEELDKINRMFEKEINKLQAIYLAIPYAERTEAQTDVYYTPMYPHQWKARHSAAALKVFPQAAAIVATIEELVKAREAVKAAP